MTNNGNKKNKLNKYMGVVVPDCQTRLLTLSRQVTPLASQGEAARLC